LRLILRCQHKVIIETLYSVAKIVMSELLHWVGQAAVIRGFKPWNLYRKLTFGPTILELQAFCKRQADLLSDVF
jgi:hypothetical protein